MKLYPSLTIVKGISSYSIWGKRLPALRLWYTRDMNLIWVPFLCAVSSNMYKISTSEEIYYSLAKTLLTSSEIFQDMEMDPAGRLLT